MKLLLMLPFLLAACTAAPVLPVTQSNASTLVPERTPDEVFAREIDRVAKLAGLPSLRSSNLAQGDAEARVWYGFGLILLEGFVIKRTNTQWNAFHLKADGNNPRYITKVALIQLPRPNPAGKNVGNGSLMRVS